MSIQEIGENIRNHPELTTFYVKQVEKQTNIAEEVRLAFLRHVYASDSGNSLQVMDAAARILARRLNLTYDQPFRLAGLENAWDQFTKTNRLFDLRERYGNGHELQHEIIQASLELKASFRLSPRSILAPADYSATTL